MNTLVSQHASILLLLCLLSVFAGGLGCGQGHSGVRVVGNVSSDDLAKIRAVVHQELIRRYGSVENHPIKSVQATTNNSYRIDQSLSRAFDEHAKTNAAIKDLSVEIQTRFQSRPGSQATNAAVKVWYANQSARWGEAGFMVEKEAAGWKVICELIP